MGARRNRPRRDRAPLSKSTRAALFTLASAADAGFQFRAADQGKLEVLGPPGVDPAFCEPTIAAIRANGAEIQRLVRWLDREAVEGRIWSPRPGSGTRQ